MADHRLTGVNPVIKMKLIALIPLAAAALLFGACATDNYPLETCLVSDEGLTSMQDDPYVYVHEGTTVKFCCEGCLDEFKEDPAKFLAKLKAAGQPAQSTTTPPVPTPGTENAPPSVPAPENN
ncbi:MAG: hypothetical protein CMO66_06985 [Verrucomicrobiales bacterium]|nr:hypothetical protein [Verrucomicrobiales bacterium]